MHLAKFNIINSSSAGTGKSTSTITLLEKLGLKTEIIIDNNCTKKGFFQLLMDYPEQDIVLDECSALLRDKATQDSIKLAMESKPVVWIKDGSKQETPPFRGNFIINTNDYVAPPVIDRCFFNKAIMNKEMTLNFIDYSMKEHNHTEFIEHIKERIKDERIVELSSEEKTMVANFIKQNIEESDEGLEYSRRCIQRAITYFTCAKKLFRHLNKPVMDYITPFAELYVINEKTPSLIEAIVSNKEIDKSELITKLAKEGNYSERHARRLVTQALEEGKITAEGRMVRAKQ